jgi:hypothetical protein
MEPLTKEKLKERELTRLFLPIEDEIALIKANAKFKHAINKTSLKETELIIAFNDDTERLLQLLKKRLWLLLDVTG